jgi:hypothetical protein
MRPAACVLEREAIRLSRPTRLRAASYQTLAGNPALDALMAETADNLRFHYAILRQAQEQSNQAGGSA